MLGLPERTENRKTSLLRINGLVKSLWNDGVSLEEGKQL